jgi:hypothetical protein
MPLRVLLFSLFAALAVAQPAPTPPPAPFHEVITNQTRRWSLTLAPGWSLAPQETVDAVDAQIARLLPDRDFACVAVLFADESRGMAGPHVQVHAVARDPRQTTLDQIEQSLADAKLIDDARRRERAAAGLADDQADETPPILDRPRRRITSEGRLTIPPADAAPARELRFLSTGVMGAREITKLILYAPAEEFDAARPAYAEMLDSFAYDPDAAFSETSPATPANPAQRPSPITGLPFGVGALLGIALLVVVVKLFMRRKPAN